MSTVASTAKSLLTSKKFWTIVAIVVVLFLVWKYWSDIKRLTRRDVTDYTADPPLTEARKRELDQLAMDLFAEFDGITWSTTVFDQVVALNNTELRYLADRYPAYSDGESLKDAIEKEAIAGDSDGQVISRLSAMNKSALLKRLNQ